MRHRTAVVLAALLIVLGGLAVSGLSEDRATGTSLTVSWVSDTARDVDGNHHSPAVARIDGETWVYAPVSGRSDTDECALVALDGSSGGREWQYQIPVPECAIHSVADPTVADYNSVLEAFVMYGSGRVARFDVPRD